jgi:hypothetical protein
MKAAIGETNRRRAIQERYNTEHGIVPTTIIKGIRDINDRLRAVAEASGGYAGDGAVPGRGRDLSEMAREQVEKLVGQMEAEMRQAARELEFERAAALRDEVQEIRLRVLEEDASVVVARSAEKAAAAGGDGAGRGAFKAPARSGRVIKPVRDARRRELIPGGTPRSDERSDDGSGLQVTQIRVLPAEEGFDEAVAADGDAEEAAAATASDWLPGIKDEHEDDGWTVKWLDRPTWDHTVTPNVIKRTGTRAPRGRRGR